MTPDFEGRADQYLRSRNIARVGEPWSGKDGRVWRTTRLSVLKVHERPESYHHERDAYIRLRDLDVQSIAGFTVPRLLEYEDALLAIEMQLVTPPFVVDFASARLDEPPDLIEDEGHSLVDLIRDRFGDRADDVIHLYHALAERTGIYLSDFHPHNIKFPES